MGSGRVSQEATKTTMFLKAELQGGESSELDAREIQSNRASKVSLPKSIDSPFYSMGPSRVSLSLQVGDAILS